MCKKDHQVPVGYDSGDSAATKLLCLGMDC